MNLSDRFPHRSTIVAAAVLAIAVVLVAPPRASAQSCAPVVNPYPNTRYEGVDLSKIRETKVGCARARSVAKGAHRKALGRTPKSDGTLNFSWRGWDVVGDLEPASDRYVASRGDRRVRWRF